MAANSSLVVSPPWSSGVEGVAAANGVEMYLTPLWEMTQAVFPGARRLVVAVEDDPECEDDLRIVYAVETSLPVDQVVQAVREWYRRLFLCCPSSAACFFRLGLMMAPEIEKILP
jgi:hypothetical protein